MFITYQNNIFKWFRTTGVTAIQDAKGTGNQHLDIIALLIATDLCVTAFAAVLLILQKTLELQLFELGPPCAPKQRLSRGEKFKRRQRIPNYPLIS